MISVASDNQTDSDRSRENRTNSDDQNDEWQFDPDMRWGGEDGEKIATDDQEKHWRDRLHSGMEFREVDTSTAVSSVIKGYVRFAWLLAVGLAVVVGFDQIDPRRQIEYVRLVTEMPLAVALGIGVLGVTVRATSDGVPDWPSVGTAIRTSLLLALLVVTFGLLGSAGVV